MDIDSEHLGIPETTYEAVISMSSVRFQEICRDLQGLSESGKCFFLSKKKDVKKKIYTCLTRTYSYY